MGGTIILTGSATGLGLHTVRNLLSRPDASANHYIFTIRPNNSSPTDELDSLVTKFNNANAHPQNDNNTSAAPKAQIKSVDLSDLTSIRSFATDINTQISSSNVPRISALILNAGINRRAQTHPEPANANTDIEALFMTNYLANFTLSLLLLESLDKSDGRIVYVSSWAHDPTHVMTKFDKSPLIQWRDDACEQISLVSKWPTASPDVEPLGGAHRYGASKLWLVMGMLALQKRLSSDPEFSHIAVVGVDPGGNLRTAVNRNGKAQDKFIMNVLGWYVALFARFVWPNGLWRTESKTAQDIVNAALDSTPLGQSPKGLYLNGSEVGKVNAEAADVEKQDKLWQASLRLADIKPDEIALKL